MQRLRFVQDVFSGAAQVTVESLAVHRTECARTFDQGACARQRIVAAVLLERLAGGLEGLRAVLAELLDDRLCQRIEVRLAAVQVVEAARHFTREFDVRALVFADRNERRLVDQDVGGLQQRVTEEAVGREVAVLQLLDLVLVGRHAFEPAERRAHREQGEQLGMFGQAALDEDRRVLGVDAGGEPVDDHLVDVLLHDLALFVVRGQCVPVGDEVEALVVLLHAHPVLQRAVVVAEVHRAGRAHSGEDSLLHGAEL